jgi:hypothetical protein
MRLNANANHSHLDLAIGFTLVLDGRTGLWMRTVGFTPPLSKTGVGAGTGTSSQINPQECSQTNLIPKKNFISN